MNKTAHTPDVLLAAPLTPERCVWRGGVDADKSMHHSQLAD